MSALIDVRPLNETEARALTERIKATSGHLWTLLLEAHEREAWRALGYETWTAYVGGEFPFNRARSYQLVDQGVVIRAIQEASGLSTDVDIREGTARRIKTRLPEITDEIRERVEAGESPEEVVKEVVAAARQNGTAPRAAAPPAPAKKAARWSYTEGRPDEQVAQIVKNLRVVATSLRTFDPGDYRATEKEIEGLDLIIKALRQFRRSLVKE